jgi:hypothetical protein
MTGLFTKSYEKTDERIKADTRNGKDILWSLIGRLELWKRPFYPKWHTDSMPSPSRSQWYFSQK